MSEYQIGEKDIESVINYLRIHDPDNATAEKAIILLEELQAGVHMLAHTNPELLDQLYKDLRKEH